jgi:hypothetical protein
VRSSSICGREFNPFVLLNLDGSVIVPDRLAPAKSLGLKACRNNSVYGEPVDDCFGAFPRYFLIVFRASIHANLVALHMNGQDRIHREKFQHLAENLVILTFDCRRKFIHKWQLVARFHFSRDSLASVTSGIFALHSNLTS